MGKILFHFVAEGFFQLFLGSGREDDVESHAVGIGGVERADHHGDEVLHETFVRERHINRSGYGLGDDHILHLLPQGGDGLGGGHPQVAFDHRAGFGGLFFGFSADRFGFSTGFVENLLRLGLCLGQQLVGFLSALRQTLLVEPVRQFLQLVLHNSIMIFNYSGFGHENTKKMRDGQ